MADNADTLLRSGHTNVESFGKVGTEVVQEPHSARVTELNRSDDYDTSTVPVFGPPQLAGSADPKRTRLQVEVLSGPNVVVGKYAKTVQGRGYLLSAGKSLSISTTSEVWIAPETVNNTNIAYVSILSERSDD